MIGDEIIKISKSDTVQDTSREQEIKEALSIIKERIKPYKDFLQNSFNYIRRNFILILLFVPFFFFFSPKVEESQCFKPIKYNSTTLYMHNCDNNSITSSSMNYINYIFEWENNPWRGRPLHILVGTLGAPVLFPFAVLYNKLLKKLILQ